MIERKNEPAPVVIEQPSAPKQAEALPAPATAVEMYLARILATLERVEAQTKPPVHEAGEDSTEPVEVEPKEPAESPKASKRKK